MFELIKGLCPFTPPGGTAPWTRDSFRKAFDDPKLQDEWKKVGMDPRFLEFKNEEESMKMAQDMIETAMKYKEILKGKK